MCTSHFFDALMTYLGFGFSFSLSHPAFPLFLFRSLISSLSSPYNAYFPTCWQCLFHLFCAIPPFKQFLIVFNHFGGEFTRFFLVTIFSTFINWSFNHSVLVWIWNLLLFLFILKLDKSTYFDFDNLAFLVDQPRQLMDTNNELPLIPTDCDSVVEGLQNFALVFESRYDELVFLNFS